LCFFVSFFFSKEKKREAKIKIHHVVVRYLLYVSCNYNTLALMYARLIIVMYICRIILLKADMAMESKLIVKNSSKSCVVSLSDETKVFSLVFPVLGFKDSSDI
jgi:hypothetical protein